MKTYRTFLISLAFLFLSATVVQSDAWAKKKLPTGGGAKTSATKASGGVRGVTTSVRFKPGKLGIVAAFSNLEIAKSVAYSLSYTQRGVREGAGGSLTDLTGTQTRELLFATCSSGVCRYHSGIKNARFVVTTTLQNGKKVSKGFRLKI